MLNEASIYRKISRIESVCHQVLSGRHEFLIPSEPARDVLVLPVNKLPVRPGLFQVSGQVRLLHDLANIELQAMELGLRTLIEFPEAPHHFREELAAITIEESTHLQLCLNTLESLGAKWGDVPVHLGLWGAVSETDNLLERVFVVHRYLEASGLDAGDGILRRLSGVSNKQISQVVKKIVEDEVDHVAFGSRWYFELCKDHCVDADEFYKQVTDILVRTNPRRDLLSKELRRKSGYLESEILYLEKARTQSSLSADC